MSGDLGLMVLVAGLVAAAAFLAVAEAGLIRMTRTRAEALRTSGHRGATRLARLLEHPEQSLNTLLLVVLACQLSSATLIGVLAERHFGAIGVVAAAAFEVVGVFVLAEAMPKTWAVQHADRAALLSAPVIAALVAMPPLRLISRALIGLANLILPGKGLKGGPFVSEQELLAMADEAARQAVIERQERELIHSVFEFGDTLVRSVMVPRTDITAIQSEVPVREATAGAVEFGLSRLPVYGGDLDDVVGILYVKDLLRALYEGRAADPVGELARTAPFVPDPAKLMRLAHATLAVLTATPTGPLDEATRARLAVMLTSVIAELESVLASETAAELHHLLPPFPLHPTPGEGELRVTEAQLVGWMHGLMTAEAMSNWAAGVAGAQLLAEFVTSQLAEQAPAVIERASPYL